MAWSTAVAATDAVPLSHDCHLHWPYPHLWLPSPPFWCPHRLHPRGAYCILGGMFKNHCWLNSLEKTVLSAATGFVYLWLGWLKQEALSLIFLGLVPHSVDKQWIIDGLCGLCMFPDMLCVCACRHSTSLPCLNPALVQTCLLLAWPWRVHCPVSKLSVSKHIQSFQTRMSDTVAEVRS